MVSGRAWNDGHASSMSSWMNTVQTKRRRRVVQKTTCRHRSLVIGLRSCLWIIVLQSIVVILCGSLYELDTSKPFLLEILPNQPSVTGDTDDILELEQQLIQQNIGRPPLSSNSDKEATIDNYYSRQHIDANSVQKMKPILIVGGSDGSGTRAVVDALGHLGVPMLVDDAGTDDVHALGVLEGAGWPPLVKLVLEATRTADYEFGKLPRGVQNVLLGELNPLRQRYEGRADELLQTAKVNNRTVTSKVHYGFKAPITMLLLPALRQVFGSVKFLHVVRDGRDIAVSDNQSPVKKFYDYFYGDAIQRRSAYDHEDDESLKSVMAIQLWNDWNRQVEEWSWKHNDGRSLDFLTIRTEDLLSPNLKYQVLKQLSHFVGSPRTPLEICCLSRMTTTDLGDSAATSGVQPHDNLRESKPLPAFGLAKGFKPLTFPHYGTNIEAVTEDWHEAMTPLDEPFNVNTKSLEVLKVQRPELYEKLMEERQERQRLTRQRREQRFQALYEGDFAEQDPQHRRLDVSLYLRVSRRLHGIVKGIDVVKESSKLLENETPSTPSVNSTKAIRQRFGKWASRLNGRADIIAELYSEGSQALQMFGYHPKARFLDYQPEGDDNFVCDETVTCD